ncbi:MAG: ABC transporter substrate-binding protein [Bacillota bacterium]|nr:ABC transporter substrate-binding protein [Bacillota bacterium]
MKKNLLVLTALVLALSLLAGCASGAASKGTDTNANNSANTSKAISQVMVGILAPLTGNVAIYGTAAKNGAVLAFDEINKNGGINGVQIKYDVLDEKGDATEAVNAYNKLVSEKMDVLLGDVTSKPTIAVADKAATDRMPMVTATATAPDVTTYGDNIFRACFIDPFQGKVMATFASDNLKAKKVAIVYNVSDDYSSGAAASFKSTAESKGMQVVAYEGYGNDDKDFKTQLTKVQQSGADALFVPDYYNRVALIGAQARSVGFDKPLLGTDGWDGVLKVLDKDGAKALDNCYFSNHYFSKDTDQKVVKFNEAYQAKYNEAANSFAALGYDAAYIIANAIKTAGTTDKEAVIKALKSTSYDGVTGTIKYGNNGDPIKNVTVIKILNDDYVLETKVSA